MDDQAGANPGVDIFILDRGMLRISRLVLGFMSDLPQTPRIASDYTTRAGYMADYRKRNREAINARKRRWREDRKQNLSGGRIESRETREQGFYH